MLYFQEEEIHKASISASTEFIRRELSEMCKRNPGLEFDLETVIAKFRASIQNIINFNDKEIRHICIVAIDTLVFYGEIKVVGDLENELNPRYIAKGRENKKQNGSYKDEH